MNIYKHVENIGERFPEKVSKITSEGKTFYLKRNIEKKLIAKRAMNIFQTFLADILRIKVLAPTANTTELSTHEGDKITSLREKGLKVPAVHYNSSEYFIMDDCGRRLKDVLKDRGADKNALLQEAIANLATLHNCGFAHGGSQIRNFTVFNGEVYMIDFEEKIKDRHLQAVQYRDIIVFLISVASLRYEDIDYLSILNTYREHSVSGDTSLKKVIGFSHNFSFLGKLSKSKISKFLGKDILFISYLIEELSALSSVYSMENTAKA